MVNSRTAPAALFAKKLSTFREKVAFKELLDSDNPPLSPIPDANLPEFSRELHIESLLFDGFPVEGFGSEEFTANFVEIPLY